MMFYPNFSTETGSSVSTPPAANDPVTEPGSSSEENEACVTSQSVVVGECQLEEEPSKDSILSLLGMRYLAPVGSNQDSFYEEQAASFVGQPLSFLADGPGQLSFSSFSALPPSFSPAPSRYSSSSFLTAASTVSPLLSSPRGVLYTPPSPSSSYPHQSQHQQLHQPDQYQHQHRTQSRGPPQISSSYSHSSPSLSCSTASSPYHQQQQRYYYQQQQLNNHQFYSDQTYSNSSAAYASSSPCHHHSQQKHHHQAPYGYRGRSPLHYQSLSLRDTASPEFPMCGRKRPAETAPMHHDDIGHCDDNCQQEDQNLTITESHYPQQPLHQGQSQHQQQNGCQSRQQQLVMGNKAKKRRVRKTWTERFQQLKEFKARFGHCKVPKGWSEDPKLARWVCNMRQSKRVGKMKEERVRKLDEIGFLWRCEQTGKLIWEEMVEKLRVFKVIHGHCRVPVDWAEDPQLSAWIVYVRQRHRAGNLSQEKVKELNSISFVWNDSTNGSNPTTLPTSSGGQERKEASA